MAKYTKPISNLKCPYNESKSYKEHLKEAYERTGISEYAEDYKQRIVGAVTMNKTCKVKSDFNVWNNSNKPI